MENLDLRIVEQALNQISSSIQAYVQGNRTEIGKLERAIEEIDRELAPLMSRESPEKLLEYLSRKVELTLKIEELKIHKGVSLGTLLKGWAPVLAPILAAVMAFGGVLIGAAIQSDSAKQTAARDASRRESELVLSIVAGSSSAEASKKLKALTDAGLIKEMDSKAVNALALQLKPSQPKEIQSEPSAIDKTKAAVPENPEQKAVGSRKTVGPGLKE